jgi:hypothetical protein
MVRNPLTGKWEFLPIEIWQQTDHQSHLEPYWRVQFAQAAAKAPAILVPPRLEHGSIPRPPFKYSAYNEDPAAYSGDGLDPNPFND